MLKVHEYVGLLLLLVALAAIVLPVARRWVVYVLALQVLLGAVTWWTMKIAPPPAHWILAILVGGFWPMANAFERKGRPKALVMGICALAAVMVAFVIYLGMHALQA